ncbi:UPF0280 family protein [Desulfallas thermosapovorans]|uniref:Thiamine biosynthesis protein ApbE n=1 Tax=Desulfallas thermosapovorans DSM 6562 TaxID=1121431 RepID=A0A5S4ZU75_9FIRM|nr:UPF0280 family protein [Desulfallas thermosapovorans]TYO96236.1 hypothetical protein LX24_01193 [Desulfallas thermosapovorans DSM 6562]
MKEYVERSYRLLHRQHDLVFFQIAVKETDLDIGIPRDKLTAGLVEGVKQEVIHIRSQLEQYIAKDQTFLRTLKPYLPGPGAPEIARVMARSASTAGTGPMSAVAGAIAQHVGVYLAKRCREVIVENGGDIYIRSGQTRKIGVFAGPSPFTNRLALEIEPHRTPIGICTSSGTVGHSLSLGKADAVVILSPSAALADAVATAAGNLVQDENDLQAAVEFAMGINSVTGALAIKNDKLAAAGAVKLAPV